MKNGLNRQTQFHFVGNTCAMNVFIYGTQTPIKISNGNQNSCRLTSTQRGSQWYAWTCISYTNKKTKKKKDTKIRTTNWK